MAFVNDGFSSDFEEDLVELPVEPWYKPVARGLSAVLAVLAIVAVFNGIGLWYHDKDVISWNLLWADFSSQQRVEYVFVGNLTDMGFTPHCTTTNPGGIFNKGPHEYNRLVP